MNDLGKNETYGAISKIFDFCDYYYTVYNAPISSFSATLRTSNSMDFIRKTTKTKQNNLLEHM